MNKKGVLELPVKLMVAVILLTISLPIISDALENNENDMMNSEMEHEANIIHDAVSLAYYSGVGTSRTVTVDLPAGCEISLGGDDDDAYSMRLLYNGNVTSTMYFDRPIVKIADETTLTGCCSVMFTSVYFGEVPGMEVSVL